MVDEINSNLEPIEESDLALDKKFGGKKVEEETNTLENISTSEKTTEKKEGKKESEKNYQKIINKVKSSVSAGDDDSVNDEAEVISKEKDVETKVQSLVNIAENKGVIHAVKVAKKLEDNYFLDELHDRLLSDELHKALLDKGLIQDI